MHFLNLVDEADLLALLEEEKSDKPATPAVITDEPPGQSPAPGEPTPQPKKNNTAGFLIMVLVIAAVGGGAFYYFKVLKPKQGGKSKNAAVVSELDEFDFDPDEDDIVSIITGNPDEDDFISIDTGEQDGAEHTEDNGGGNGEEMPDFTISDEPVAENIEPDNGGDIDLDFDFGDLGAGTPESEDNE